MNKVFSFWKTFGE